MRRSSPAFLVGLIGWLLIERGIGALAERRKVVCVVLAFVFTVGVIGAISTSARQEAAVTHGQLVRSLPGLGCEWTPTGPAWRNGAPTALSLQELRARPHCAALLTRDDYNRHVVVHRSSSG